MNDSIESNAPHCGRPRASRGCAMALQAIILLTVVIRTLECLIETTPTRIVTHRAVPVDRCDTNIWWSADESIHDFRSVATCSQPHALGTTNGKCDDPRLDRHAVPSRVTLLFWQGYLNINPLPMSASSQSIPLVPLMSLVHSPVVADHFLSQSFQRKRTASFSVASTSLSASPRPTKAPRKSPPMGLRRTESYLSLPIASSTSVTIISVQGSCLPSQYSPSTVPYHQSLQYYKEQRQRCKAAARANTNTEPITIRTRLERTYSQPQRQSYQPQRSPSPSNSVSSSAPQSRSRPLTRTTTLLDVTSHVNEPSSLASEPTSTPTPFHIPPSFRASSPLSPKRHLLPGRPVFPRSKAAPDLYRIAIKTCMRYSPEGQKILRMGPRLALSILTATQDLERIVAERESRDSAMEDKFGSMEATSTSEEPDGSVLSSSWIDVQNEDWEMLDRTA